MTQKLTLVQEETIPPQERSFPKVNTMFLDLLKNPVQQLSDISEELASSSQEENSDSASIGSEAAPVSEPAVEEEPSPSPDTIIIKRRPRPPVSPPEKPRRKPRGAAPPPDPGRRSEVAFQYEILRKLYPDANIPPAETFASLDALEENFKTISRKIEMATTIDKSKKVFVVILLGSEFLLGKLGLNMAGFTLDQLNNMESYNDVLYELGKKYAVLTEAKIEPELKLVGLLIFSILAHLVSRTLEMSGAEAIAGVVQQSTKHTFKHLFG